MSVILNNKTDILHHIFGLLKWGILLSPKRLQKSLRVNVDKKLSLRSQIDSVISSCFSILQRIKKLARFLTQEALTLAVMALFTSRLDYANSLYIGLPKISYSD